MPKKEDTQGLLSRCCYRNTNLNHRLKIIKPQCKKKNRINANARNTKLKPQILREEKKKYMEINKRTMGARKNQHTHSIGLW